MFLKPGTLNPTMKVIWSKTGSSELQCVVNDSITTVKTNLIFFAIKPAADPSCLPPWSAGLTERKLTRQYTKIADLFADKAWKIKSISLHLQEDQQSNVKVLLLK